MDLKQAQDLMVAYNKMCWKTPTKIVQREDINPDVLCFNARQNFFVYTISKGTLHVMGSGGNGCPMELTPSRIKTYQVVAKIKQKGVRNSWYGR